MLKSIYLWYLRCGETQNAQSNNKNVRLHASLLWPSQHFQLHPMHIQLRHMCTSNLMSDLSINKNLQEWYLWMQHQALRRLLISFMPHLWLQLQNMHQWRRVLFLFCPDEQSFQLNNEEVQLRSGLLWHWIASRIVPQVWKDLFGVHQLHTLFNLSKRQQNDQFDNQQLLHLLIWTLWKRECRCRHWPIVSMLCLPLQLWEMFRAIFRMHRMRGCKASILEHIKAMRLWEVLLWRREKLNVHKMHRKLPGVLGGRSQSMLDMQQLHIHPEQPMLHKLSRLLQKFYQYPIR